MASGERRHREKLSGRVSSTRRKKEEDVSENLGFSGGTGRSASSKKSFLVRSFVG